MQEHTKLFKSIPHNPPKYIGLQYVVNQGLYIVNQGLYIVSQV